MAGFFYFLPGEKAETFGDPRVGQLDLEALKKYELDTIFRDCVVMNDETIITTVTGPDGQDGVLLYPRSIGSELPRIRYDEDKQTWIRFKNFYIGWLNDEKPGPDDILRRESCLGYPGQDVYGREWSIPVVASNDERRVTLPQRYGYDADGNFVMKRRPQDLPLYELAGRIADVMDVSAEKDMKEHEVAAAAIAFLSVNYRVSPAEIYAFDVMGTPVLERKFVAFIFSSVTDWGKVNEFKKKEEQSDQDIAGDSKEPSHGATG